MGLLFDSIANDGSAHSNSASVKYSIWGDNRNDSDGIDPSDGIDSVNDDDSD